MTKRILIIGGYGNFGSNIAKLLCYDEDLKLIIAGRDVDKALRFARSLKFSPVPIDVAYLDIHTNLAESLDELAPDIVVHTSGPYQGQDYQVAQACIDYGCHYIDLADSREFVSHIGSLDEQARKASILVCSGASSVPCLTSAIVDKYQDQFKELQQLDYAISTAQRTNRGLATTSGVLSYAGKPFKTLIDGKMQNVYGWLDLTFRKFWSLNTRPLGNGDIPDLDLFPERYPDLQTIRFRAGLELKVLQIFLWLFSWCVRLRLLPSLQWSAPYLLKISRLFDIFGSSDSGFYMTLTGIDQENRQKSMTFNLVARNGDGLNIPVVPAVILVRKLARGQTQRLGATPCLGLITLEEYLSVLCEFDISWETT